MANQTEAPKDKVKRRGYFIPLEAIPEMEVIKTLAKYVGECEVEFVINTIPHKFVFDGIAQAEPVEVYD